MKIGLFYHCRLSGGEPPIKLEHALDVMTEQMDALRNSNLLAAANEFHIGVNGGDEDHMAACCMAPEKAIITHHGKDAKSELPTIALIREWLKNHPGWYVCYHHIKGATHADASKPTWAAWRRCMENVIVHNWKRCVADLDSGFDTVGAHWMTPEKYPGLVANPYWGGNFWWAKADYLSKLPEVVKNATQHSDFYEAESWIGRGNLKPRARDYAPHWPGAICLHGV